jgi:hypothetical protein
MAMMQFANQILYFFITTIFFLSQAQISWPPHPQPPCANFDTTRTELNQSPSTFSTYVPYHLNR